MRKNLDTNVGHGTKKMKSVPYLKLSEDGVYYYRRRVPTALVPYFNKNFIKLSLNTKDFKKARLLRDEVNHFYQTQFDAKEKLLSLKQSSASPILKTNLIEFVLNDSNQKQLGKTFLRQLLKADEDMRLFYGEDIDQLNEDYRAKIFQGDSFKIKSDAIRSYKNIEAFYDFAWLIASNAGIDFDSLDDTEKKKLTREYLIQEQQAGKVISERDNNNWQDTDSIVKLEEQYEPSKTNWKAVYELWEISGEKRKETVNSYKQEFELFKTFVKNKSIETVDYKDALAYQKSLIDTNSISNATVKKRMGFLKTIFSKSFRNHLLKINPFDIEFVKVKKNGKPRSPFDTEDLVKIFTSPVFSSGQRGLGCGGEASVWIPILAYATGAREDEICQLRVANLKIESGIYYLEITEEDEEGKDVSKLKTVNAVRKVPLHKDVINAGFIEFVRTQKQTYIFNDLSLRDGSIKRNINWGKWFMRYLRNTVQITNRKKVFHSFRHTFVDLCRNHGVTEEKRRALVGHAQEGVDGDYGNGFDVITLNDEIQKIKFPVPIPSIIK